LLYLYPAEFESRIVLRKALIVYIMIAAFLFQGIMFLMANTELAQNFGIYLFAFLILQLSNPSYLTFLLVTVFSVFEFIRKPWEGREIEIEKVKQEQMNHIFDSISSDSEDEEMQSPRDSRVGFEKTINGTGDINMKKIRREKIEVLMKAY